MAMPIRPADPQIALVIDRFAEFVARNGAEFEAMAKIKQQNNERFGFLKPGNIHYDYYQFRVREERRNVIANPQQLPNNNFAQQQQQQPQQSIWSNSNNGSQQQNIAAVQNITAQIEEINAQQNKLKEQIYESQQNLNAQHQVLSQQQKKEIEETISKAQMEHIKLLAQENDISLTELDQILQPIIDACTKDSIANGKASILQQATNSAKRQIISQYILKNVKKNADDLKNHLESVVIPMFCNATISANEEQKDKLSKLLTLWSSKANFFDSCAISKLQSPPSSLQEYQNSLLSQYSAVIAPLNQIAEKKFDDYRQQHQAFVEHAKNRITILEAQKQILEQQSLSLKQQVPSTQQLLNDQMIPSILNNVNMNMLMTQNRNDLNLLQNIVAGTGNNQNYPNQAHNIALQQQQQQQQQQQDYNNQQQFINFNLPPPNLSIPDMSRPPPNFQNVDTPVANEAPNVEMIPNLPFFELPAGLMVTQINIEDYRYRPIDPEKMRGPLHYVPEESILAAIEAFYAAPSHERPRDNEGWEKLSLYEYFKTKNYAKKAKEDAIARGEKERSKSPTPIPEHLTKPQKKIRKRVYRSESPEKRSKSRSRSKSPELKPALVTSRSRKPRSPSPSPAYRNFKRDRNERNRKRSVTPPSFAVSHSKSAEFIDEGNKGHQMLKKLGWQSGGLGAGNQGIAQPISGGEVRDRSDMYKGVGLSMNDPYENFRKNRSNSFITRMKSRSEVEKN